MISSFREFITGLKDNLYGNVIVEKSLKHTLWYWTKFLLLIAVVPYIFSIIILTRFLPQLPKLITQTFPEGTLTSEKGILSSTISQPYTVGDKNFSLVFDLEADPSALDSYQAGALVLKDRIIVKDTTGVTDSRSLANVPDFSLEKSQISSWISARRTQLWFAGLLLLTLLAVFLTAVNWLIRIGNLSLWAAGFWFFNKFFIKQTIDFMNIFKLVVYASVLPLLLSVILFFAPSNLLTFLGWGLLVYFTYTWLKHLRVHPPVPPQEPPVSLPKPHRKLLAKK